jgi:uncharacterized spore protein YtfJ
MAGSNEYCEGVPKPDKIIDKDYVAGNPVKVGDFTLIPIMSVTYGAGCDTKKGGFFGRLSPKAILAVGREDVKVFNIGHGLVSGDVIDKVLDGVAKPDHV